MSASESLCCCEYDNMNGERSHLLATFCDCEAFDQTCDKLLKCNSVPSETLQRLWLTVSDRCRIPWCSGKGAVKLKLDIVIPVIMIPSLLSFATLGFKVTIAVLIFMPIFILVFYTIWRKQGHKRTQFFFIWGLTSVLFTFIVFCSVVVPFREILLWEILLLLSAVLFMLYALMKAKRHPGYLRVVKSSQNRELKYGQVKRNGHLRSGRELTEDKNLHEIQSFNINMEDDRSINESEVKWVDSRPIREGRLIRRCDQCKLNRPPRSGHCNICDICIEVRDHHCVWIDNCVGANNHRSFLAAMILFIFCGFYGAHLTLTTICTPDMVFDWFLLPTDCRWLYAEFSTSLCFVTTCYTLVSSSIMCFGLIHQLLLISQNLTSQELHNATIRGLTTCCFFARNNVHNQGVLRNWIEFLFYRKRRSSPEIPS